MAVQISRANEMTLEEFEARYAGKRYEYIDGYAVPLGPESRGENGQVIVAATKPIHGRVVGRLTVIVGRFVLDNKLGEVFGAETGFLVKGDIRAAVIAFYPAEQVRSFEDREWLPYPPVLAVEVISEYDRTSDTRRKTQMYMDSGTRLLWMVYPDSKVVDVFRPGQPILTLGIDDMLTGEDVLPGFQVAVKDLFAPLTLS